MTNLITAANNDPKLLSFFLQRDIYNNESRPQNKTITLPTIRSNMAEVHTYDGIQAVPYEPMAKQMLSKGSMMAYSCMTNDIINETKRGETVITMDKDIKDEKKVKGYIEDLRQVVLQ